MFHVIMQNYLKPESKKKDDRTMEMLKISPNLRRADAHTHQRTVFHPKINETKTVRDNVQEVRRPSEPKYANYNNQNLEAHVEEAIPNSHMTSNTGKCN